jgi:hypothetical protein
MAAQTASCQECRDPIKKTPQQKANYYFRTKTMILKMPVSIVLLVVVTLITYDAQAAKLPPLIKIVSAQGATYFIDPGKSLVL